MTVARGLSAHEAQAMSARLNQSGIAVTKAADGAHRDLFQLEIADHAVASAVEVLSPRPEALLAAPAQQEPLPLVPTQAAEERAREAALDARLRALIRGLPGVVDAAVQTSSSTPRSTLEDLERAAPRPELRANVQLIREAEAPALSERVRELLANETAGLPAAAIHVAERTLPKDTTGCATLVHLGPITLTIDSLSTLRMWLIGSALVHMASAIALLVIVRRSQQLRRARRDSS